MTWFTCIYPNSPVGGLVHRGFTPEAALAGMGLEVYNKKLVKVEMSNLALRISVPGLLVHCLPIVPGNLLFPELTKGSDWERALSSFFLGFFLDFWNFKFFRFWKLLSDEESEYLAAAWNLPDHRPRLYNHHWGQVFWQMLWIFLKKVLWILEATKEEQN